MAGDGPGGWTCGGRVVGKWGDEKIGSCSIAKLIGFENFFEVIGKLVAVLIGIKLEILPELHKVQLATVKAAGCYVGIGIGEAMVDLKYSGGP